MRKILTILSLCGYSVWGTINATGLVLCWARCVRKTNYLFDNYSVQKVIMMRFLWLGQ